MEPRTWRRSRALAHASGPPGGFGPGATGEHAGWSGRDLLAQLVLHHLARGIARELGDEMEHTRALVVGEAFGAEGQQRGLVECRAGGAHHERADVFTEHGVR